MEPDPITSLENYLRYLRESGVDDLPRIEGGLAARGASHDQAVDAPCTDAPLDRVREDLGDCTRCPLARSRTHLVFGEGNPEADVLFVGEAPGYDEDQTGRPFVGKAGQQLNRIIEQGMKLSRAEVYICNVLKCRPPDNRTPAEAEVMVCLPFLRRQIEAVRPRVIVALGRPAAHALLGTTLPMHRLRGTWHRFQGIPVMPTFHPAYLLRNHTRAVRGQVWEDVKAVLRFLAGTEEVP